MNLHQAVNRAFKEADEELRSFMISKTDRDEFLRDLYLRICKEHKITEIPETNDEFYYPAQLMVNRKIPAKKEAGEIANVIKKRIADEVAGVLGARLHPFEKLKQRSKRKPPKNDWDGSRKELAAQGRREVSLQQKYGGDLRRCAEKYVEIYLIGGKKINFNTLYRYMRDQKLE